jgi:hypothetical protein
MVPISWQVWVYRYGSCASGRVINWAGKTFKNLLLPCLLHARGRRSCTVPFKTAPCSFFFFFLRKERKKKFRSEPKMCYDNNKEWSLNKSKRLKHNKKRLKHNKKRSMNNKKRLMNSFAKWSWTWQHIVKHVRLILFGRITTSLLQDLPLLLQLHLYINL